MKQRLRAGAALALALAAAAIGFIGWPDERPDPLSVGSGAPLASVLAPVFSPAVSSAVSPEVLGASPPQYPLPFSALPVVPVDTFLGPDLRQDIEALLLEAGALGEASDPASLKRRAALLVARYFPADAMVRTAALVDRYIDYRVALGSVKAPTDPGDPRALRDAIQERDRVRLTWFTPGENEALFAAESELDRYTLARLRIERSGTLTASQRAVALREAEAELSGDQRAQRADATSHLGVADQTAAFEASGATEQARYAQRQALYGNAAARQLEQLDRDERYWQNRLGDYDAAGQNGASADNLQHMRGQLFSESEQLRLPGALAARPPGRTAR